MTLKPITRQSIPDEIFGQLAGQVLSGDRTPGDTLPSERTLSEALGVSRAAVREALGRLDRARLIQVRQGGSTVVRDFRAEAGFDVLPLLLVHGGDVDRATLASLVEARAIIGPQVAALAAARATDDARTRLRAMVDELEAESEPVQRMWRALGFWEVIVDSAESIAFRLLFNTLNQAYVPALDALVNVMAAEVNDIEHYRALADAIAAGDADAARLAAAAMLELGSAAFGALANQLEGRP
ncbi:MULTISPECIES: FadR/GntR family transcriptional regulator [Mycolicibacter]|uniref:FadR family transcriptional regulator n=1 Tax=Mycolicibacter virginiensis TaxID=1795032 RepID=A0A9X7NWV3_9MYCO|nr:MULTISPECIES: GntR family transcriptional regulator [Mycobacteriaceae]OBG41217.1 GntR family transcriptional regulator [Mycolicibacter heraklionensis]OBJ31402.1 GntR family transcriptional regulator [Mycolicibacter heraklionensis]PQM50332.1 FadR family transcriptional regulator [Mycolicibacter virginiensis]ULP48376.1 GntR family transcriptional regulator [Mycolicibacter virginiensis]